MCILHGRQFINRSADLCTDQNTDMGMTSPSDNHSAVGPALRQFKDLQTRRSNSLPSIDNTTWHQMETLLLAAVDAPRSLAGNACWELQALANHAVEPPGRILSQNSSLNSRTDGHLGFWGTTEQIWANQTFTLRCQLTDTARPPVLWKQGQT